MHSMCMGVVVWLHSILIGRKRRWSDLSSGFLLGRLVSEPVRTFWRAETCHCLVLNTNPSDCQATVPKNLALLIAMLSRLQYLYLLKITLDIISRTQMPTIVELFLKQWSLEAPQIVINGINMAIARTCGLKTKLSPNDKHKVLHDFLLFVKYKFRYF